MKYINERIEKAYQNLHGVTNIGASPELELHAIGKIISGAENMSEANSRCLLYSDKLELQILSAMNKVNSLRVFIAFSSKKMDELPGEWMHFLCDASTVKGPGREHMATLFSSHIYRRDPYFIVRQASYDPIEGLLSVSAEEPQTNLRIIQ